MDGIMLFKWATILNKYFEPVSRWCCIVGGVTLLAMMLLIVAEVVLRSSANIVIPGTIELVKVLLVIVLFAGMAYTGLRKRHVRVSILVNKFSPVGRLATTAAADLIALGIISIISWQSFMQGEFLKVAGYQTGVLHILPWPFAIASGIFVGIFALVILVDFFETIGELGASGNKNYLWLVPGISVALVLFAMSFWPSMFPIGIGTETFGIISLLLLFTLIFLNVHIGAAMAMVTLWGMSYLVTPESGQTLLGMTSYTVASNYIWSVAPLFMLMGLIVAAAGFSRDLYNAAYKWVGHTAGGLASATVAACGGFAAVVGDSLSGVVTMGTIALPQMKAFKYSEKLATGSIAAGGTIGFLIPPSLAFIVYGILTDQSIGRLFVAGILPGILLTGAFMLSIYVRCRLNPSLGPPGPAASFREKLTSIKDSFAVAALFILVIGGIYAGFFTPNEAGAIGAFGALIIGVAMRRITFKGFTESVIGAMGLVAMLFFIFIYATSLTQFFAITKLPFALADFVATMPLPPYAILVTILVLYLVLGCVMNSLPVVILTLPIIYPTVIALNFDPIWFGVLMVLMIEIGQITPPIGMNVFCMAGVAPDVPMYNIFRGVLPFWIVMLIVTAILIAFPSISLFLPNLMMG